MRASISKAPTPITAAFLRRWPLSLPEGHHGKEDRGQVVVLGGSDTVPGAVLLAALGALRAGAGKLQIATAASVAAAIAVAVPEARVVGLRTGARGELARGAARAVAKDLGAARAILVGPGMMSDAAGVEVIRHAQRARLEATLVVDSAPLTALRAARGRARSPMIVTPHAGEMAGLWGIERDEVEARPLEVAREAAAALGAVVVLKGAVTHVVAPDGTAFANRAGNPGLGTSGSGDTLSGVVAGLCARGVDPVQAAVWAVHLHARAGDVLARRVGPLGFLARELLAEIPREMAALSPARSARRPR